MANAITVTRPGAVITTSGTSANVAIPAAEGASQPKYVRLAATQPCYVRLGVGAGTAAVAGDLLVQPADAQIVRALGLTHVAALQVSGPGVLQISPIEDN